MLGNFEKMIGGEVREMRDNKRRNSRESDKKFGEGKRGNKKRGCDGK